MAYEPLILPECPSPGLLGSPLYRRFLVASSVETGLRFFMQRQRRAENWPFLDTKFNPNTGAELPRGSREVVYTWFLGRGVEALVLHLEVLDSLQFSEGEKAEARSLFGTAVAEMCRAIVRITEANNGRIPFMVDRAFRAIGRAPDTAMISPADLFCAKGLLVSPESAHREAGVSMLAAAAERVANGAIEFAPDPLGQGTLSQAMRMLFLSVPRLLDGRVSAAAQDALYSVAREYIGFVMDRHFDEETKRFSEWIAPETGERGDYLDPGHCTEFVGLAYSALRSMDGRIRSPDHDALRRRANALLPEILLSAVRAGFNQRLGGMYKAVDNRTGKPIDASMPWWNLPETMRAALFAFQASPETSLQEECLRVFAACHNAYFVHYLNRANMLFPFQTRSGESGQVLDAAPAVPEGDPLYHSNLCFLDMMPVLGGVQATDVCWTGRGGVAR